MKKSPSHGLTDSCKNNITLCKRKPSIIEIEDGKRIVSKIFKVFLEKNNTKRYSCYTSKRGFSANWFKRTNENSLRKPVLDKGKTKWIVEKNSVTKEEEIQ